MNSYPGLQEDTITSTDDRLSEGQLAEAARPLLDRAYSSEVAAFHRQCEERAGDGRPTTDISGAACASTFGAVEVLMVDMDTTIPGAVDEQTGAVSFSKSSDASSYGVVDEIMSRALRTGAKILSVRASDLPPGQHLAAILRYAV